MIRCDDCGVPLIFGQDGVCVRCGSDLCFHCWLTKHKNNQCEAGSKTGYHVGEIENADLRILL